MTTENSSAMESTIYSLNDDVLVEIFSYIDTDHLVNNLCTVCERWAHLIAHDSRIWKDRWLEWNLSTPISAMDMYLKRAPLLQKLKVFWDPNSDENSITDSDTTLRNLLNQVPKVLEIYINFPVTSDILQCINPNLRALSVINICNQYYPILSRFQDLETLKLGNAYDFCGRHLRLIAEECDKIKNFQLGDCRSFITSDVVYFLKMKKSQIEILELNGYGLTDEVFVLLPQCKKLRELCIRDSRLMRFSTFVDIVHYSHIKVLLLSRLKLKYDEPVSEAKDRVIDLKFSE